MLKSFATKNVRYIFFWYLKINFQKIFLGEFDRNASLFLTVISNRCLKSLFVVGLNRY